MDKNTKMFDSFKAQKTNKQIVKEVYECLEEKDYNPIDQLVGYIITGDPSYKPANNARALIKGVDRDELVAEMLRTYIDVK
ncbi:MAG: IreB family regulatory phosphoprotein [Oscillospiraceae bacterium]